MIKKLTLFLTFAFLLGLQAPALAQEAPELPEEITNMKSEGFTLIPADPNTMNQWKFIYEAKPGTTTRDSVVIKNLSGNDATFSLYGTDSTQSAQGTLAYKTRDASGEGQGNWITFDEPEVTLGPGEEKLTSFTLSIPEDAELGDYRLGIAMEKTKKDINNPNVTIATRYVSHTEVKVTNNPQPIPKMSGDMQTPEPQEEDTLQLYYFWISLALFITSFIALVWITFQEKKSPVETFTTSAAAGGSKKRSTTKKKSASKRTTSSKRTTKKKTTTKKKSAPKKKK